MYIYPEKPINNFLKSSNSKLGTLFNNAAKIALLDKTVQQMLEPELQPHCRVFNYQKGCLTLATDNAHWSFRLKFMLSELLASLRTQPGLHGITMIKVKVHPLPSSQTKAPEPSPPIVRSAMPESAASLRVIAQTLDDDVLKEALKQLADDLESPNN